MRVEHYVDEQLEDIVTQVRSCVETFGFDYDDDEDRAKFLRMSISLFHYIFSTREELIKEVLDEIEREFKTTGDLDIEDYLKHRAFKLHAEKFISTKIAHTVKEIENRLKHFDEYGAFKDDFSSSL
mgnify:CR=1 FL=1|tara:strand:+ start:901 stop:1278 length:378 start_codon:yes stop_codon:yes gene_type:complete